MTTLVFHDGGPGLRVCPQCHGPWPQGEDFELRSFRWLGELPRHITPSNTDWLGWIHDGAHGRDRFLVLEAKGPREQLERGQEWFLRSLARLPGFTVRVLRGSTGDVAVYRITPDGAQPIQSSAALPRPIKTALSAWVDGKEIA